MVKGPTWFKFYGSNSIVIDSVSDEIVGRAVKLATRWFNTGEEPSELDDATKIVFNLLKNAGTEAYFDYISKVEAGKISAQKRWNKDKDKNKIVNF